MLYLKEIKAISLLVFIFFARLLVIDASAESSLVISPSAKQELSNVIESFNKAIKHNDTKVIAQYIPPHLLDSMSLRLGEKREKLIDDFIKNVTNQINKDKNQSYQLSTNPISYGKTSSGLVYAIVPSLLVKSDRNISSQILAIYEDSKWYLIYGGAKTVQNPVFSLIYPSAEEIHFKADSYIKTTEKLVDSK